MDASGDSSRHPRRCAPPVRGLAQLGPARLRGAGHRREPAGDAVARPSERNFDLRCELREALIDFIGRQHPKALPRLRAGLEPIRADGSLPGTEAPVAG